MNLYVFFKERITSEKPKNFKFWDVFFRRLHLNLDQHRYEKGSYGEYINLLLVLIEYGEKALFPYQHELQALFKKYDDEKFLNVLEQISDIVKMNSIYPQDLTNYQSLLQSLQSIVNAKKATYYMLASPAA